MCGQVKPLPNSARSIFSYKTQQVPKSFLPFHPGSSESHFFHLHDTLTLLRSPSFPFKRLQPSYFMAILDIPMPSFTLVLTSGHCSHHRHPATIRFDTPSNAPDRLMVSTYVDFMFIFAHTAIFSVRRPLIFATNLEMITVAIVQRSLCAQHLTELRHFHPKQVIFCIDYLS